MTTTYWPPQLPRTVEVPAVTLWHNLAAGAAAHPDRRAIVFGETVLSWQDLHDRAERVAGWLQQVAGVRRGDRVLLLAQNSPAFVAAFYGVLRADAVVVPVNAMSTAADLAWLQHDSGACMLLAAAGLPTFGVQSMVVGPEDVGRVHRPGQGRARQARLRQLRQRQQRAQPGRAAAHAGRPGHAARALQGAAPRATDLLGGQLTSAFVDAGAARSHLASVALCALAVTGIERLKMAPDEPLLSELGYKHFEPKARAWAATVDVRPFKRPPACDRPASR